MATFGGGQQEAIPVATVIPSGMVSAPPWTATKTTSTDARALARALDVPDGVAEQLVKSAQTFAARYFVVDNSGSMTLHDGHKVHTSGGRTGTVSCSRWDELGESLEWLAKVAVELKAYAEFRLLNPPGNGGPQVVRLGTEESPETQLQRARSLVSSEPAGRTPLCAAIRGVVADLAAHREELLRTGKRACVVIASDGEASDGDVGAALAPLRDLPCWVVVRLCTDEDRVVEYWNHIDEELELDLDVLDDLAGEAAEIKDHAPYLTYGLPLHRLREWGCAVKLIDVLDERRLSVNEVLDLVTLVFGAHAKELLPHPELNFKDFCKALDKLQASTLTPVWDPVHHKPRPWFDVHRLNRSHGKGLCAIM